MTELLFIAGLALAFIGRIDIGTLQGEGPKVRAAGFMLMMPLIVTIFLGFVVGLMSGGDLESVSGLVTFIELLRLPVLIVCVGIAYMMLRNPNATFTRPTIQPKPPQQQQSNSQPTQKTETPKPVQPVRPKPPAQRGNFPSIMGIKDAARYLNTSETNVMKLIEEGKLSAARINYRYQISRHVLDEFLEDQDQ